MNREWLRGVKNLPIRKFEKTVNETFDEEIHKTSLNCYKFGWAAAFMAFWEATGASKNQLQRLAERTVELRNNALCAEELVMQLYEKTGFDINQRPSEYVYEEELTEQELTLRAIDQLTKTINEESP